MSKKYQSLVVVSVLCRIVAVAVVLGGIGVSLWYLLSGGRSELSRIVCILGIGGSVLVGCVVYALSEVITLLFDIAKAVKVDGAEKI